MVSTVHGTKAAAALSKASLKAAAAAGASVPLAGAWSLKVFAAMILLSGPSTFA
jgi:hypothetical protein